jgi:NADH-quinone oxidoreductase subunit E
MEATKQDYFVPFETILRDYTGDTSQLIPLLQKLQEAYGYLPQDIIVRLSSHTDIKVPEILGVATFYSQFRLTPMGKHVIKLCHGTACHVNGADNIGAAICDELGIALDETTEDGLFTIETVACLGCCSLAPVMMVDGEVHGRLTQDKARKVIREIKKQEVSAQ